MRWKLGTGRRSVRTHRQVKGPGRRRPVVARVEALEARSLLTAFCGVTDQGFVFRVDSETGTILAAPRPLTGLGLDESVQGMDIRPEDGRLYALTLDPQHVGRLYAIDTNTNVATLASRINVPLSGNHFELDFDPSSHNLRIVGDDGQNLVVALNLGVASDEGSLAYAPSDPNAGRAPQSLGLAYSENFEGANSTTAYVIDANNDLLSTLSSPGGGTLTTVGSLGLDATSVRGFDIRTEGGRNLGYASLEVDGRVGLYRVDLATGAATRVTPSDTELNTIALATTPAGYSARLAGSTAIFQGSVDGGNLIIDQENGLLRHNQFALGVPGYHSPFDFDSTQPGDQTLRSTDREAKVRVEGGSGDDRLTIGSATTPVSSLVASFVFNPFGGDNAFTIDDSADETARSVQILPGQVNGFGPSISFTSGLETSYPLLEQSVLNLVVQGGQGDDRFRLDESFGLSLIHTALDGGGGSNIFDSDARDAVVQAVQTQLRFLPFQTYTVVVDYTRFGEVNLSNVRGFLVRPLPIAQPVQASVGALLEDLVVARFLDEDPGGKSADYRVSIDWGDGTTSVGTVQKDPNSAIAYTVTGSHRYAVAGQYQIKVTIEDLGGAATRNLSELPSRFFPGGGAVEDSSVTGIMTTRYAGEQPVTANTGQVEVESSPPVPPLPLSVFGQLDRASDSGLSDQDAVTNVRTPTFRGTSDPGVIIQIFNGEDPSTREFLGWAIADANGAWQATLLRPLADGLYQNLIAEATSPDGSRKGASSLGWLLIDTESPVVSGLTLDRTRGELNVSIRDNQSGLIQAPLFDRTSYALSTQPMGRQRGLSIPITQLTPSLPAGPGWTQRVQLTFGRIPPNRNGALLFLLRSSKIQDLAGNLLDGAFSGQFPSGNGRSVQDFQARIRRDGQVLPVAASTERVTAFPRGPLARAYSRRGLIARA